MLWPLARTLREHSHAVSIAPLGLNTGCGESSAARVAELLANLPSTGELALVGHSRGGQIARVVAARDAESVQRLVTVATPWSVGPPQRRGMAIATNIIRTGRRLGVDMLPCLDCATDTCCQAFRADLTRKPTAHWHVLWSSRDSIAGPDAFPPSVADAHLDTRLGHVSSIASAVGISRIVEALAA
jgi:pimeloyl-ACP methyl ester carboxylesterase